jgi:hypothetical protein
LILFYNLSQNFMKFELHLFIEVVVAIGVEDHIA